MFKKIILTALIILVMGGVPLTWAANTQVDTVVGSVSVDSTMTFDSTGALCLNTHGYPFVWYSVNLTSGTATWEVHLSEKTTTTTPQIDDPIAIASADNSGVITSGSPFVCVQVTVCSSCAITAIVYAVKE